MENAIVSLIPLAVTLTGMLVMAQSGLSSTDIVSASWQTMSARTSQIASTRISKVAVAEVGSPGQERVRITLRNEGPAATADFDRWDVIVQYYPQPPNQYNIKWLPYTESDNPDNQWRMVGIYEDAQTSAPEVREPGILNPGEEIILEFRVTPPIGGGSTNWVTIGASKAIPISAYFIKP